MANHGILGRTTPVVLNLIIINTIIFLAQGVMGDRVFDLFALHHIQSEYFRPYQLLTHMFMHGSFFHLLFNMFALWMFGCNMERLWGQKKFLIFYFICGFGAAIAQLINYGFDYAGINPGQLDPRSYDYIQQVWRNNATVGASGAIMGVLAAFGYTYPNVQLFIMPIPFPIKAKWAIIGIIALDVFGGFSNTANDNVAHFAHVGGALIGFLIVWYWNRKNKHWRLM
ncbi:MAG: rhomboid family intramembrane serine protease [Ferruginibacter sp.]|nr:rhomboid family intramembrane serine protease [Ferruginibacter sp.]